ncbi:MAG: alcohol dehydrogenase catalytic domain-containing protein [Phycisphaerae bacterium]|nr:alcohol dehydrogenase catalytic domain-containing protein [Phycisphaerae bacterium]
MKACVFDGKAVRVEPDYPDPEVRAGEVRVRVRMAGICRTDLEIVKGYMGFRGVLGHEFVGVAESGRHAGRRVVGEINCPCGRCDLCREGLATHCRRRTVLGIEGRDGAFAERLALPEENLHPVPDTVPDEQAVFAEPLAAAIQIGRQVDFHPGEEVVVLGDGRLGQLVAQVLRAWNVQPTVVGRSPTKLAILERLGIAVVPEREARPAADTRVVVECTGSPDGLGMALRFVRPRGTIVLKSTVADTAGLDLAPIVVNEVTVVGSRCGPMDEAVAMLGRGEVRVEPLVTATYALDEAPEALRAADRPDAIKVLIRIEPSGPGIA